MTHPGTVRSKGFDAPPISTKEFERFRSLIHKETGISLSPLKKDLLRTRLRKRLQHLEMSSFSDYYEYVCRQDANGKEMVEMINRITTNKTDFFREEHHFSFLKERAFPEIVAHARSTGKKRLRIWSAACSTGQEPYSIAISIREYFQNIPGWDARILASDIDSECLEKASAGVYGADRIEDIPLDLKRRHFLRGTGDSREKVSVRSELKNLITFRRINFADKSWPINTKFDIIFCRNAMIYFDREFQDALLRKFMKYLAPHGYLILGHSENVSWMPDLQAVGKTIYRPKFSQGEATHPPRSALPISSLKPSPAVNPKGSHKSAPIRSKNRGSIGESTAGAVKEKPAKKKSIVAGEVFASNERMEISTLLGSCIAACLYDPTVKVGGMNHFLLPTGSGSNADTACFGINAMELLITELMMLGGDRNRMVARIYGGAHVVGDQIPSSQVGIKNTDFVRKYLTDEGIPILDETLGGDRALRVKMIADTGEVTATKLERSATRKLSHADKQATAKANKTIQQEGAEQIVLF